MKEIYRITKLLPKEEIYGLVSQLRRAGVSISSNLAEGAARKSSKEKKRFYEISRFSLVEVDTQIEIFLLLEYLKKEELIHLEKYNETTFRMLSKIIGNLELNTVIQPPTSTEPNPLTTS